jgi:hypothetical protein
MGRNIFWSSLFFDEKVEVDLEVVDDMIMVYDCVKVGGGHNKVMVGRCFNISAPKGAPRDIARIVRQQQETAPKLVGERLGTGLSFEVMG